MSRTLILHDYFQIRGGGERLVLDLQKGIGADLLTGFWDTESFLCPEEAHVHKLFSFAPPIKNISLRWAYRHRVFLDKSYEHAIYSGVLSPFAALNSRVIAKKNIYYCHTPPRYLYDQKEHYRASLCPVLRPVFKAFCHIWEKGYRQAVQKMDCIIANSINVQKRLKLYLNVHSHVIYPPIDTENNRWTQQGNYYLSTARLTPLKRIDRIIDAFKQMPDQKLIVASGGSEEQALRKRASGASNISFTGWIDDATLRRLIGCAIAVIYVPVNEDFGMSPVEAMAAGKPVIGVAEGGLLETITDGQTGLLVQGDLTANQLIGAVQQLNPSRALSMRQACEARAQCFAKDVFLRKMRRLLT